MPKPKQIEGLIYEQTDLPVYANLAQLNFAANRFFRMYALSTSITFTLASTGNTPGNRITCILVGDGENVITLPFECKIVRGVFNPGYGVRNLIEFQFFSNIVITKIYQIP